jgi:hypothetical protein
MTSLTKSDRYAASVIITFTYGKPTTTTFADPMIQKVTGTFMPRFGKAVRPGAFWIDTIPFLRYMPGYLSELNRWHLEEVGFYKGYVDAVRAKLVRIYPIE